MRPNHIVEPEAHDAGLRAANTDLYPFRAPIHPVPLSTGLHTGIVQLGYEETLSGFPEPPPPLPSVRDKCTTANCQRPSSNKGKTTMATFTRIEEGERPSITVNPRAIVSKIEDNVYGGFTE